MRNDAFMGSNRAGAPVAALLGRASLERAAFPMSQRLSLPSRSFQSSTMLLQHRFIPTSHGDIAVTQTASRGLPVLLIHGNSSCRQVFNPLLESELGEKYRLIAFDLPGHGASNDAVNPEATYSLPGYAAATIELLDALKIDRAVVYGWSLGGCIALEMMARSSRLIGMMLSGAPPVRPSADALRSVYRANPDTALFAKPEFTVAESMAFTKATYDKAATPALRAAARRTDGRARAMTIAAMLAGNFADGVEALARTTIPVALVDGADDPYSNTDYVAALKVGSLWEDRYHLLDGVGHVPFLQAPESFRPLFARFIGDMAKVAAMPAEGSAAAAA